MRLSGLKARMKLQARREKQILVATMQNEVKPLGSPIEGSAAWQSRGIAVIVRRLPPLANKIDGRAAGMPIACGLRRL
jgi:hypothetical protein